MVLLVLLTGLLPTISFAQRIVEDKVDGSFRFVSETISPKNPGAKRIVRKAPDWEGIFIFQEGVFSIALVDQSRPDDWHTRFPQNADELGYQSVSGKYELKGNKLFLKPEIALSPFSGMRPVDLEISWEGGKLV